MALNKGQLLALGVRAQGELGDGEIDVLRVLADLGLRVHLAEADGELEGMYVRSEGIGFVFLNTRYPPRRVRFTAAHELGHHMLIPDDVLSEERSDWTESSSPAIEEQQAMAFARELLMDRTYLVAHYANSPHEASIAGIVDRFDVSPEVAAIRLAELRLISEQDKSSFLDRQRNQATRTVYPRGNRPAISSTLVEPAFDGKVRELRNRGILSDKRYRELLEHASPSGLHAE